MSILGIDFGIKRTGLAISYYGNLVKPLTIVETKNFDKTFANLLKSENIDKIVIGLPDGKIKNIVLGFAKRLEKIYKLEVVFCDETLTSQKAKEELIKIGVKRKKRRTGLDARAACLILENYLSDNYEKSID
jgi:putative Holliday junction resolvase